MNNSITLSTLEEEVLKHKQLYYYGNAEISDAEYDKLEEQLKAGKPNSPVLSFVGHKVTGESIKHDKPMLSLEKVKDVEDLLKWSNNEHVTVTDKIDGSACSLVYENGFFKLAKTRGDGEYGEDITNSVKYMEFPRVIKNTMGSVISIPEVRGEICITKDNFKKLQEEMQRRGLQAPESMRNCVAGLLHRKTHADLCKYLTFLAYSITKPHYFFSTESVIFIFLEKAGFSTPNYIIYTHKDHITDLVKQGPQDREYLTDGLVFAINDLDAQVNRGFTSHHPRGKMAFKFKSETAITEVKNIITDVGRTGKLSFVAEIEPVFLSGANISRLTLHNWKYVKDHKVSVGSKIEITRSNEVIPKHVRTVESAGVPLIPQHCPLCTCTLVLSDTGVDLCCKEITCPAKAYGRLEHWVNTVEIDNVGDETLKNLFDAQKVRTVSDFYKLSKSDIEELPRAGKRSAKKIFDNIQKTKEIPLDKFLASLSIEGLGKSVSRAIAEKYLNLDKLFQVSKSETSFSSIEGIGSTLSGNIVEGLNPYAFRVAQELQQVGVTITNLTDPADLTLDGLSFVITGSLNKPRKMIQDMIKQKGGKVSSSVSSKTSYLVCNEVSGSSKSRKAQELDISIINEEKLLEILDK